MLIRYARPEDLKFVDALYKEYDFKLEPNHLQSLAVAISGNEIVGVMSLNTILECCFLANKSSSRRNKIQALKHLVALGVEDTRKLGFDGAHGFANPEIAGILKKHFNFVPGKGENLFLFV